MALASELVQAHMAPGTAQYVGGIPSTLACAGSVQGDAAAIGSSIVTVTGADATKGVILPASALPGDSIKVYSSAATNALKVYPPSGAAINAGSANAAYSHTAQTVHVYTCFSSTSWLVV